MQTLFEATWLSSWLHLPPKPKRSKKVSWKAPANMPAQRPSAWLGALGFSSGLRVWLGFRHYLDPKICRIMAFMGTFMGLRLLFYIVLGFRYWLGFIGLRVQDLFRV